MKYRSHWLFFNSQNTPFPENCPQNFSPVGHHCPQVRGLQYTQPLQLSGLAFASSCCLQRRKRMDTPCCLTAAASAASVPCAQSSLRDLSESRFHPQACAGLSLGETHNSNIYTQVFYFDKREAGFLIFIEGCKHECYPKVHQNIHSVQTCAWISKLRVLSCESRNVSV